MSNATVKRTANGTGRNQSAACQNNSPLAALRKTAQILRAPKNAAQRRLRTQFIHNGARRVCQLGFFLAFPAVFSASFNGVKYVFGQLGGQQPIELTGFVALLLAVLAFTCVFGRFFCGYACAFGTLGDAVFALARPLRRALKLEGRGAHRLPAGVQSALQLIKFVVLAGICALCFTGAWQQISSLSPWVSFAALDARNIEGVAAGSFVALGIVVAGMALIERFFCQFLCPLGAVFSLLPVLPFSILNRNRERCAKRCNHCQDSCPVRIHPDRHDLKAGECIACGRCADGCPMANIALVRIERNLDSGTNASPKATKPGQNIRNLCGNGILAVIIKAVILAVICHALV